MKNIQTNYARIVHLILIIIGLYALITEWIIHTVTDNHIGCIFNALFAF